MSVTGSSIAPHRSAQGFTLIEMLVVLTITALLAGIAWPRLQGALVAAELRQGISIVAAELRAARARAIATQSPVKISIGSTANMIEIDGQTSASVAKSVRIDAPQPVTFFGDGSSGGGAIAVSGQRRRWTFTVRPATGLFTMASG